MTKKKETRRVTLALGAGGEETRKLIDEMVLPRFDNHYLRALGDSAVLDESGASRIAFTTDSYVIDPIFFPGGDIGYLSVCGTVNDLAMSGAVPRFISCGLMIEEGLPVADLERILDSMARACKLAQVELVAGDTKVVAHGAVDKIFINTAGVGLIRPGIELGPDKVRPGDQVIVSGPVGSHGIAVLLAREDFSLETELASDVAPLVGPVGALVEACPGLRMMRDPTRGGLAGVCDEIAKRAGLGVELEEKKIPVLDAVRGACEILGFEPMFLANEGIFVAVVPEEECEAALRTLERAGCPGPSRIGKVVEYPLKTVSLRTVIGGKRLVTPLGGELLPRIC